jgi:hypothetical protein
MLSDTLHPLYSSSRLFKTKSGEVNVPSGGEQQRENMAFLHKILLHEMTNDEGESRLWTIKSSPLWNL